MCVCVHRPLNVTRARLQRVDSRAGICYESRVTNGRTETEKAGENCWGKEEGDCWGGRERIRAAKGVEWKRKSFETVEFKIEKKEEEGEGKKDWKRKLWNWGEGERRILVNRRRMCTLKVRTPVGRDQSKMIRVFREIYGVFTLVFIFVVPFSSFLKTLRFPEWLKLTAVVVSCSVNEANYNRFLRNSMRLNVYGILTAHTMKRIVINITFYSFNVAASYLFFLFHWKNIFPPFKIPSRSSFTDNLRQETNYISYVNLPKGSAGIEGFAQNSRTRQPSSRSFFPRQRGAVWCNGNRV